MVPRGQTIPWRRGDAVPANPVTSRLARARCARPAARRSPGASRPRCTMAGRPTRAGSGRAEAAAGKLSAGLRFIGNPLPMWVYGLETLRILDVNDAALALYGYDRGEFVCRRVTELRAVEHAGDETVCIAAT